TLIRVNSPMRPASTERTRISTNQEAAQCFETGGISLGERKRASDARHSLPEDGTMEHRSEAWFEFAHGVWVQDAEINAELLCKRTFTGKGCKAAGAAVKLQPAILAQQAARPGLGSEHLVLGNSAGKQRSRRPSCLDQAFATRCRAKRPQPGSGLRQVAQMVIRFRRALYGDAQQRARVRGKNRRENGIALKDAGISVGCLLARRSAIDQGG